jgi:hypothetical protein
VQQPAQVGDTRLDGLSADGELDRVLAGLELVGEERGRVGGVEIAALRVPELPGLRQGGTEPGVRAICLPLRGLDLALQLA